MLPRLAEPLGGTTRPQGGAGEMIAIIVKQRSGAKRTQRLKGNMKRQREKQAKVKKENVRPWCINMFKTTVTEATGPRGAGSLVLEKTENAAADLQH